MKKVCIPFSGGMDSSVMLFEAIDSGYQQIDCITFEYGQRHRKELECAEYQVKQARQKYPDIAINHLHLDVTFLKHLLKTSSLTNDAIATPNIHDSAGEAQPKSYVPFRNQIFLSICCGYCESNNISELWLGATRVDSLAGYWDCDETFLDQFNNTVRLNREFKITVAAPLLHCYKSDIVRRGVDLGVDFSKTYTCYSGEDLPDANTPSSSLRIKGFIECKYKDPLVYKQQEKLEMIYKLKHCREIPYL